jgi:hypothetical protein
MATTAGHRIFCAADSFATHAARRIARRSPRCIPRTQWPPEYSTNHFIATNNRIHEEEGTMAGLPLGRLREQPWCGNENPPSMASCRLTWRHPAYFKSQTTAAPPLQPKRYCRAKCNNLFISRHTFSEKQPNTTRPRFAIYQISVMITTDCFQVFNERFSRRSKIGCFGFVSVPTLS